MHRPGLPPGPGRAVGPALHGAPPDRRTAVLVEPHDVEGAAVRTQVPTGRGQRVLHREATPLHRTAEVRGLEEQLEVHQVVDVDGDLARRSVPGAEGSHRRDVAGGQCGGRAPDDRGVGVAAGQECATPEAGLQQEAEVVGGGVVLPYGERRLGRDGSPGPDRPPVGLVGEPEPAGPEAGQPAAGAAGPPRPAGHRDGREPAGTQTPVGAGELVQRVGPGLAQRDLDRGFAVGRQGRTGGHRGAGQRGDDDQGRRQPTGPSSPLPVASHVTRRYRRPIGSRLTRSCAAERTRSTARSSSRRQLRPTAPAGRRTPCRWRHRRAHRAP